MNEQKPQRTELIQSNGHRESQKTTVAVFPGDDPEHPVTALVKMTSRGAVKSTMTRVPLRLDKEEVYTMSRYDRDSQEWVKKPIITAAGYNRLNQFGGVSFATPESIIGEDGQKKGNPYFHRESGEVIYVKVRRVGIGRNAVGNLVAIDLTVTYDLSMYFAQDVWAKWTGKKSNASTQNWAELYAGGNIPEEVAGNPKQKLILCPGGVTLALNLQHKEVINLIGEHINRQKFAERNAITICERNILKKFFAAAMLDSSLKVPVVSWQQTDLSMAEIVQVAESASEGQIDLQGESVEVVQEAETVSDPEEVSAALHGDADEEQARELDGEIDELMEREPADDLSGIRSEIRACYNHLPKETAEEALQRHGFGALAELVASDDREKLQGAANMLHQACEAYDNQQEGQGNSEEFSLY